MNARRRILLSAYACEPGAGSEPGIGWHTAVELAREFEVWVVTRANNRSAIERHLSRTPQPHLHFVYSDLPGWLRWWKKGVRGVQVYYYLWQLWIWRKIYDLHHTIEFDVVHHITFGRYWSPSLLAHLGPPFVWGPVGGGDSVPAVLRPLLAGRARVVERCRDIVRRVAERDPLVRSTARDCTVALAATPATAKRLEILGARDVRILPAVALPKDDIELLATGDHRPAGPIRFVSIGKLLYWKGFDLGLRAFAQSGLENAEYMLLGDGPERARLRRLATELGAGGRVSLSGQLPRASVLRRLRDCDVLVHPSLHDSGGWVCLEAMAAARPVLCLDLAGPSVLVDPEAGMRIRPGAVDDVVAHLARAMRRLGEDPELRVALGRAGARYVRRRHSWSARGRELRLVHSEILGEPARRSSSA